MTGEKSLHVSITCNSPMHAYCQYKGIESWVHKANLLCLGSIIIFMQKHITKVDNTKLEKSVS